MIELAPTSENLSNAKRQTNKTWEDGVWVHCLLRNPFRLGSRKTNVKVFESGVQLAIGRREVCPKVNTCMHTLIGRSYGSDRIRQLHPKGRILLGCLL
ncbi:hypothetical protein BOTBODRAFT_214517 [Botryobasidium botryosum FD-172 SS1]|uniref:Uncharacterized protein n=1 Tax=Botryobasidium botryosum (strain FD-172 SS1) TaxID=930990 RepID=A0A067N1I2_BOTB1|nr:hypothetical protein BOTBODRAFT_214517 [Botryobasidium botryosum FD-172 SS1]